MGYSKHTIIGLSWMTGFRILSRIVAFVRVIILARILVPAQFGIFGIATLILALLEILTETGINVFLVQEKDEIRSYVNEAWLVSIIRGILISIFILVTSPFLVTFFKIQGDLGIIMLISIVPFIKGFINPAEVKFQKELQFNKEFYFRTAIFTLDSFVAVIISVITHSVLGLIIGLMAGALLEVILSFTIIKPIPVLKFEFQKIAKIFHQGKWVTLSGIFNYAASKGDSISIGKILGASSLGLYQMGYTIATLPVSEIADVVNKVTFPVYSIISGDIQRLKKAFKKTLFLVSGTSILAGLVIYFFPKELFVFIFGQRWVETVVILKPLAIFGIIRTISGTTSSLFFGMGRQHYVAGATILRFAVLAITIIPFTVNYGIMGAAYSVLMSGISEVPLVTYYVWKTFKNKKISEFGV